MITIRPIDRTDFPSVIRIITSSIMETQSEFYPETLRIDLCKKYTLEKFAEKAREIEYFVAEDSDSGGIRGIIGLKGNELRTFFVDPQYQGQGIGRRLYEFLEQEARSRGIQKITLQASPRGEKVYRKFGFKQMGTVDKQRVGIPYHEALMEKEL